MRLTTRKRNPGRRQTETRRITPQCNRNSAPRCDSGGPIWGRAPRTTQPLLTESLLGGSEKHRKGPKTPPRKTRTPQGGTETRQKSPKTTPLRFKGPGRSQRATRGPHQETNALRERSVICTSTTCSGNTTTTAITISIDSSSTISSLSATASPAAAGQAAKQAAAAAARKA
eukprot:9492174-Pyramimonas_sp.AAC.2